MATKVTMHGPCIYELQVRGALDASWIKMMELETVTVLESDEQGTITILHGMFQDQAALRGLLDRLYRLNLPLISVQYISDDSRRPGIDEI